MTYNDVSDFKVDQCVYVKDPETVGFIYQSEYERQHHTPLLKYDSAQQTMVVKIKLKTGRIITVPVRHVHNWLCIEGQLDHPDAPTGTDSAKPERRESVGPMTSPFAEKSYQKTQKTFEYSEGHLRSPIAPTGENGIGHTLKVAKSVHQTIQSTTTVPKRTVQATQEHRSGQYVGVETRADERVVSNTVEIPKVELEAGAHCIGVASGNELHTTALLRKNIATVMSTAQYNAVQAKIDQQKDLEATEDEPELVKQSSLRPTSISSPWAPASYNPHEVIYEGTVEKNGTSVISTWRKRRFVQTADMFIRYYDGQKLKGEIDLRSATAVYSTCADGQYWTIVTPNRKWLLWCDSRSQTQQWIAVIQRVIEHLHSGISGPKTAPRLPTSSPPQM